MEVSTFQSQSRQPNMKKQAYIAIPSWAGAPECISLPYPPAPPAWSKTYLQYIYNPYNPFTILLQSLQPLYNHRRDPATLQTLPQPSQ